jgi:hypothetical protein
MKHQYEDYIKWIDKKTTIANANIQIYEIEHAKAVAWLEQFPDSDTGKYRVEQTRFMLQDWKERHASLLANKATLERHKPVNEAWGERIVCEWCENLCHSGSGLRCNSPDAPFPCPPLLDITNQLDELM